MGTTLTGKRVQNTYDSLIKIGDNDNLTGTAKRITDGLGNDSPIFLSTTRVGIGVTPTYEFQTNSNAKIGGNLIVGGNLTVNGTTTHVDSTIVEIGDNMIELAKDNISNTKDIGWYGTINSSGEKYVGVFYDASSGVATPEFHIGLGTVEPDSTASWTVKGKLVIGSLDATTGVFSGQVTIPETPSANTDAASKGYVDSAISSGSVEVAKRIEIIVKNISGASLSKGTIVHASPSASPPSGNVVEVIAADYDDATKMPGIGILNETIANEGEGAAVMMGAVSGIDTSSFSAGDELFVGNDGAFTNSKPTATNQLVQKIAVVIKVHASNGSIKVFGAGRSNDVPNLLTRDITIDGADFYFGNADQIRMGDSIGLRLQHNGSHSFVDGEIGNMYFRAEANDSDMIFEADDGSGGNTDYVRLDGSTGAVNLYHYGSKKFETTSLGVTVTGELIASTLLINGTANREFYIDTTNPDHLKKKQNLVLSADPDNSHTNTLIVFHIDDSEKASLNSTGNFSANGRGTFNDLELTSGADHLTITESSGDWTINNAQQNNGITIYDGTGGVDINYASSAYLQVDNTGVHTQTNIDFYVDTDLLYVDATNNLVGIGKTPSTYKLDVNGKIASDDYIIAGLGNGGVALTHNDGEGNANVTFNHVSGIPEQNGNSFRITANTDSSTNAVMRFEIAEGVTQDVAANTTEVFRLEPNGPKVMATSGGILSLQRDDASIVDGNPIGRLRFSGDDPTNDVFNMGAEIRGEAAGTWATDNYPTELQFYTTTTNALSLALKLDSSQKATFTGDLILESTKKLYFDGEGDTYIFHPSADQLSFRVGGQEFMRFTEDTSDTVAIYKETTFYGDAIFDQQVTIEGASPTLTFEDSDAAEDNYKIIVNSSKWRVYNDTDASTAFEILGDNDAKFYSNLEVAGNIDLTGSITQTGSGLNTFNGNIKIDQTNPTLSFQSDDTNISGKIQWLDSLSNEEAVISAGPNMSISTKGTITFSTDKGTVDNTAIVIDTNHNTTFYNAAIIDNGTSTIKLINENNVNYIYFGDADNDETGYISYNHNNDMLSFKTDEGSTDFQIDTDGHGKFWNDLQVVGAFGINMAPPSAYQFATSYTQTDPNADFRFAHFIDANFSGADNTTGDREQGGIYMDIDSSADGDANNEHRLYGIYLDQRFSGYSDVSTGIYSRVESNNNTEKTANIHAIHGYAVHDTNSTGGVSSLTGVKGEAAVEDDGDIDNAYGVFGRTLVVSTRAVNVDNTYGGYFEVQTDSPNAISYGSMHAVTAVIDNNEGSVPTFGNQYLYYGDYQGTRGAAAYGVYCEGDRHYLEGLVSIGNNNISGGMPLNVYHASNSQIRFTTSGTGTGSSDGFRVGYNGTVGQLFLYENADIRIATNNTPFAYFTSDQRFGIGIDSPAYKFHVSNNTNGFIGRFTGGVSSDVNIGIFGNSTNNFGSIGTESNDRFSLFTNGVDRLNISNTGSVGINVTNPNAGLQIALGGTSIPSAGSNTGSVCFGNTTSGSAYGLVMGANSSGVGYISSQRTDGGATTYNLAIQPNGGNVGIGNSNPLAKLQITSGDSGASSPWSNADELILESSGNAGLAFQTPNTGAATIAFQDPESVQAGFIQYLHADNALRFATNGNNERMRITSGGNVGIGLNAPYSFTQLHIYDTNDIYIAIQKGTANGYIINDGTNISLASDQGSTGKKLLVNRNAPDNSLIIDSSGNADFYTDGVGGVSIHGVGNSSEGGHLTLKKASSYTYQWCIDNYQDKLRIFRQNDDGTGGVVFAEFASDGDLQIARYLEHDGDTNSYLGWSAADDFRIVTGGRELVRLDEGTNPDIAKFMTDEFRMYSSGDFHADGDIIAYSTTASSDKRLKKNIKPIDNALDIVDKLQGVHFNWKKDDKKSIGYIAQDVEKVLPEMVKEQEHFNEGTYKTVNYAAMVSIMGEAIKELNAKVEALENKKCNCNCK